MSQATSNEGAPKVRPIVFPGVLLLIFLGNMMASSIDPILTKNTLDQVVNDGTSWFGFLPASVGIALGLYLVSIAAPVTMGKLDAEGQKLPRALLWGWAGLGLVLFLMRWFEDVLVSGGDFSEFNPITHLPMALAIAALYVLTMEGYRHVARDYLTSPWHLARGPLKKAAEANKRASEAAALAHRIDAAREANRLHVDLWSAEYDAHLTSLRNAEASVKDQLRSRIVEYLADPAEASAARRPHRTTNAEE